MKQLDNTYGLFSSDNMFYTLLPRTRILNCDHIYGMSTPNYITEEIPVTYYVIRWFGFVK
jgi:hypothetical protein